MICGRAHRSLGAEMNSKIFFRLCGVIVLVLIGIHAAPVQDPAALGRMLKIPPPQGSIELQKERHFPTAEQEARDIFLAKPEGFAIDVDGSVFVADIQSDSVMKFDKKGDFQLKFGRSGQGPGDLSGPMKVFIEGDHIIVGEVKNRRLQYFTKEGKPIDKVVPLLGSFSFITSAGQLYAVPMRQRNENEKHLIEILSDEGKLIRGIGKPIDFKIDEYILNAGFLFVGTNGAITFVFKHLPIIRRYRTTGEFTSEQFLKNDMFIEKEKYNREMNSKRPDTAAAYIEIVHHADVMDDVLYLYDYVPPRMWIRAVDDKGRIGATYWAIVGEKYSETEFKVRRENGRIKFYVLQSSPEARVEIFSF